MRTWTTHGLENFRDTNPNLKNRNGWPTWLSNGHPERKYGARIVRRLLLMVGSPARNCLFTLGFRSTEPSILGKEKGDWRSQGYVCKISYQLLWSVFEAVVRIIEYLRSLGWGEELGRTAHRVLDLGEIPSVAKACRKNVTDRGWGTIFCFGTPHWLTTLLPVLSSLEEELDTYMESIKACRLEGEQ